MRILSMGLIVGLITLLLSACTGTPDERPVAAVAAAGATTAAPAPAVAELPATTAKARPGYKVARRDGDVVYCKREVPTGSRRPVETCYTPEQLDEIERQTREMQDALDRQRNSSGCGNFCSSGS